MKKRYIVLIVIFLILIFCFVNCPFLFGKINFQEKNLEGNKALIISDLHLENNHRDLTCIGDYLEENGISFLILNGDIFDKKHKEHFQPELLYDIEERLGMKTDFPSNVIYNFAFYSHDPRLKAKETQNFQINGKKFDVFQGIIELKADGKTFDILHGDYILNDTISVASLINKLTPSLLWERIVKNAVGIDENNWAILSHSHVPGIDYQRKIANTGTWINRYFSSTDTAILIMADNNKEPSVALVKIPCGEKNYIY